MLKVESFLVRNKFEIFLNGQKLFEFLIFNFKNLILILMLKNLISKFYVPSSKSLKN
jgi:hypothetical protein